MSFKKVKNPQQPPKKRVKVQALFWLEPDMAIGLKKLAAKLGLSQSELARDAFGELLKRRKLWTPVNTPAADASEAA